MKRNEKILVYAVTGFLGVVLAIAVLFGNDTLAGDAKKSRDLAAMMREADLPDAPKLSGEGPGEDDGIKSESGGADDPTVAPTRLDARAGRETSAADKVRLLFGPSEKAHSKYRRVAVRTGDNLGVLAERWCGTASTAIQQEIRLVNEGIDVDRLPVGSQILLPWVDDEELIEAHEARLSGLVPGPGSEPGAKPGPATEKPDGPNPGAVGKTHVVQSGENAWVIAKRFVDTREIPAFLDALKRLNPHIASIDSLGVGDRLNIPE